MSAEIIYNPSIFNVASFKDAQDIALTFDGVRTPQERWRNETAYLLGLIEAYAGFPPEARWLDYGCGAGRLSKPLTQPPFNGRVVGVDISPSMMREAAIYVDSPRFLATDPLALEQLLALGARFDFALAIWVLQHVINPVEVISLIHSALVSGGRLLVLNANLRFIPTGTRENDFRWVNDGFDISKALSERFIPIRMEPADSRVVASHPPAMFAVFERS